MASAFRLVQFGGPQRLLTGIYHPPAGDRVCPAVLLCKPFGPEAVRAHRLFRVLAERLARQGHPVLRFDYFGSGDSMGDEREADLAGWALDVRQADEALMRLSGLSQRVWLAARLGCVAALQAVAQAAPDPAPQGLILWDPVVDGMRYVESLAAMHVDTVRRAFPLLTLQDAGASMRQLSEVEGFALSASMREGMARVSVDLLQTGQGRCPVSCLAHADEAAALRRWLGGAAPSAGITVHEAPCSTDWAGSSGDGSIMVRPELVGTLLRLAGEGA